jgi:thiol-disulfide isomerase/thioredoxin
MKWFDFALVGAAIALTQPAAAAGSPKNFVVHDTAKALPEIQFEDGDGHPKNLTDFHGKVVLLNVWATWCVPCRREMPTLDRLQTELGSSDLQAIPLSIDRGGVGAVRKFYAEIGIHQLPVLIDVSSKASIALGVVGLLTTILIDRDSREIGRLIGVAEWDSPEMVAFLKSIVTPQAGALPATQQEEKHS